MRAEAHQVGKTKHAQGVISDGNPMATEPMGEARWVEITEDSGGFLLLRYNDADECVGDTWHLTLAEAKAQAEFEYGISEAGWHD